MRELEQLCRPLVRQLCAYWYYARCGEAPDREQVNRVLREHLIRIREKVEDDGRLKREFRRIEQPLIFFIDYTIKEGNFPFSEAWREIARDYNELSGDEKFFEQLAVTLDDPDSAEQLVMFYLFMGLGFDGCHAGDPEYIQRRMKVCAARFPSVDGAETSSLGSPDVGEPPAYFLNRKVRFFSVYTALAVLFLCLIGAWGWNFWVLYQETGDFRRTLHKATLAAGKIFTPEPKAQKAVPQKGKAL